MAGNWLRLETKTALFGWTSKLSGPEYAAFVKLLQMVKVAGKRGGRIPTNYFDAEKLRQLRISKRAFSEMLAKAKIADGDGSAINVIGGEIIINSWNKYQLDPTVSDRVAKHRAKDVTGCNGPLRDVTAVTVGNGCNDDVTGRDVTGHIYDVTPVTVTPETAPNKQPRDSSGVEHLEDLIDDFNDGKENPKGLFLRRPSAQKIRAKLLGEGFDDSELQKLTLADLKKSIGAAERLGYSWGPGFLGRVIDEKRKKERAHSQGAMRPQPESAVDPRQEIVAKMKKAEMDKVVTEVRAREGCSKLPYMDALYKWADEQLEKEPTDAKQRNRRNG